VESTCYAQGTITASGGPVFIGEVANDFLPLGTHIVLDHPVFGRGEFVVEDRIGSGSELDFYNPSESVCLEYGRERIGFSVVT
jgi:3D (Asp-Asp-Asp) domain-containing protein